jgi:NADH dehydrogenase
MRHGREAPSIDSVQRDYPWLRERLGLRRSAHGQHLGGAGGPHRVVVVGGGFGGLPASRYLASIAGVDVTLIDRRNHHLFQPLLYQVATGILSPGQIATPLRHVLGRSSNARVELGEVVATRSRSHTTA